MAYQFLRGTTAENDAYTGPEGSFTVDLDTGYIRLHDGITQGGMATITNLSSITAMLTNYAEIDNNLSDLGNAATARTNLGLGSAATNDDSEYVRTDQAGEISGTLTVSNQLSIKNSGSRHLFFRNELGEEDGLVYHSEGNQGLVMRLRNGGGANISELSLESDGDIRATTGRFAGPGSGLTNLSNTAVSEAISGSQENEVGTYGFMKNLSGGTVNPGQTLTGANLQFANNIAGSSADTVNGTWRCMGYANDDQATLFLRIS